MKEQSLRIMPYSQEAEQAVIGAMIMDREAIASASGILVPEDFYQKQFGLIFEALVEINNKAFVCDYYQAKVISKAMQEYQKWSELYRPKQIANKKNKPLHLLLERGNNSIRDLMDENNSKGLYLPFKSAEMTKEYGAIKDGFVMLVRPNKHPEKYRAPFEKALDYFSGLNEKEVSIMYSMWKGYLSGEKKDKHITDFIGKHYKHCLHVSGHAYPETILKLIEKTNPKVIIPMHTEMADKMSRMPLFEKYTNRIVTLNDNKDVFDIEKMVLMNNT